MEAIKSCFLVHIFSVFFSALSRAVSRSAAAALVRSLRAAFLRLCGRLDRKASASMLGAWLGAVGRWAAGHYRRSFLRNLLGKRSRADGAFERSLFGTLLNGLLRLPDRLLRGSFTGTVLQPLGSALTVPLLAFAAALIMSLPYEVWNNYYALYLAVLGLLFLCLSKERQTLSLRGIGFWPLAFGLLTVCSGLWSQDVGESLRFVFFALTGMLFVLIAVNAVDTRQKLLWVGMGVAVGLFVCCGYGIYQKITGVAPNAHYTDLSTNANMPGRVYSFFDNPNSFANIPVLFGPLMLALCCHAPKGLQKCVFGAAFLVSTVCLVTTFTRGAWLAWVIAVFVFVLIMKPKLTLWLAALCFCCIPLLPDSIINRFLSIFQGDSSISSRTPIYQAILKLISRHPVFGVGLGSTNLRAVINEECLYEGSAYFVHGHNVLFQICGESGVFALLSFLLAGWFSLRDSIAAAGSQGSRFSRAVTAGAASGILGSLLFGLTDYIWSYPRIMLLYWLLFGVLLAAAGICRKEVNPSCD